jgi:hypothetical protein
MKGDADRNNDEKRQAMKEIFPTQHMRPVSQQLYVEIVQWPEKKKDREGYLQEIGKHLVRTDPEEQKMRDADGERKEQQPEETICPAVGALHYKQNQSKVESLDDPEQYDNAEYVRH